MTTFALRPYQQAASDAAVAYLMNPKLKGRNGIIVQPTGGGKSLCLADIVTRLDGPSIVLQPSKEILAQNAAKLASYGRRAAIFSASFGRREIGAITLATIGSVVRHAEAFKDLPYVLIDEAHAMLSPKGGMYREFLDVVEHARICGLSATPFRLATNMMGSELRFLTRTRPRVFRDVIHITQIQELVSAGYWCPLEYRRVSAIDRSALKINSTSADYTDKSVQQTLFAGGFVGRLVAEVESLLAEGRKHILVFTRFIDESRQLAQAIPGTAVVTSETPADERDAIVRDVRAGKIRVVSNVNCLALGFDFPALDTVVLGGPTISLARYYQQIGRAVRPHPSKAKAVIVDMVGLTDMFGHVEDLAIRASGKSGEQWAVHDGGGRQVTNVNMAELAVDPAAAEKAIKNRRFWAKRAMAGTVDE